VHAHVRINWRQIWKINRGKQDHFAFLLICPKIFRMTFWDGGSTQLLLLWLPTVAARGVWRAQRKRLSVSNLINGGSIDCNKRGFEELYFSTLTQNERQEITRVSWISIWLTYRRKMFSLFLSLKFWILPPYLKRMSFWMTPFFFYQYNDTQLSCVFKKKNVVLDKVWVNY